MFFQKRLFFYKLCQKISKILPNLKYNILQMINLTMRALIYFLTNNRNNFKCIRELKIYAYFFR